MGARQQDRKRPGKRLQIVAHGAEALPDHRGNGAFAAPVREEGGECTEACKLVGATIGGFALSSIGVFLTTAHQASPLEEQSIYIVASRYNLCHDIIEYVMSKRHPRMIPGTKW